MSLSPAGKRHIYARESGDVDLELVAITHPDLAAAIRVANNTEAVVHRGETYEGVLFRVSRPQRDRGSLPSVPLEVDNVDRRQTLALRAIAGKAPPQVMLFTVLASEPDLMQDGPYRFELRQASYDVHTIRGRLQCAHVLDEPDTGHTITPATAPGLFRGEAA